MSYSKVSCILALLTLISLFESGFAYNIGNKTRVYGDITYLLVHGTSIHWKVGVARTVISLTPRVPDRYYGSNHFCSGVLITPIHVLSAAVCFFDGPDKVLRLTRNLIAVAGWQLRLSYSPEMTKRIRAKKITVHPHYITHSDYNIAILEVEYPFPIGISAISIAKLPTQPPQPGDNCIVLGWGRVYKKGPLSNELKKIDLTLKSAEDCQQLNPNFTQTDKICAVDEQYQIMSTCEGDMGAPLFCNDILCGLTYTNENCQSPNPVSLFTDVYFHGKWISKIINEAMRTIYLNPLKLFTIMSIRKWIS